MNDIAERLDRYEAERDPEVSDEAAAEIREQRELIAALMLERAELLSDYADLCEVGALAKANAEIAQLRDKALRFDLDQAGIERRERESVELVEARAELVEATRRAGRLASLLRDARDDVQELADQQTKFYRIKQYQEQLMAIDEALGHAPAGS